MVRPTMCSCFHHKKQKPPLFVVFNKQFILQLPIQSIVEAAPELSQGGCADEAIWELRQALHLH